MSRDPSDLLCMPFALWYMWKGDASLVEVGPGHENAPRYALWLNEAAAETLIGSDYLKIGFKEPGKTEYILTERGKRYCEILFGNQGGSPYSAPEESTE